MAAINGSFQPTPGFIRELDNVLRWVWNVTVDEMLSATSSLTRADIEPLLQATGKSVSLGTIDACDAALYRLRPHLGRGVVAALASAFHEYGESYNYFNDLTTDALREGAYVRTALVGVGIRSEKAVYANACTLLPEARQWLRWDLQRAYARRFATIAQQFQGTVVVDVENLRNDHVFQNLPQDWRAHKGRREEDPGDVFTYGLPPEVVDGLYPGRIIGIDPLAKCFGFDDAWLVAVKLGAEPTAAINVAWAIMQAVTASNDKSRPAITAWGALERGYITTPQFMIPSETGAVIPTPESMWNASRPVLTPWLRAYEAAKVDYVMRPNREKLSTMMLKTRGRSTYSPRSALVVYDSQSLPAVPYVLAADENSSVLEVRPDGFNIHCPGTLDVDEAVTWMPTGEETRALIRDAIGQWRAVHLPEPHMLERIQSEFGLRAP